MKKIFLFIFLSYLLFFILIPPLNNPDEPEHYENSFWLSEFIYPYLPKNKEKPNFFVDNLSKIYLPVNFEKIFLSPLRHQLYSQKKINDLKKSKPITLQSYHPPLYYFFLSSAHHLANLFHFDYISRFYLTRILSGLFYLGIVYLAYLIFKILFENEIIISTLLIFFSLNPLVVRSAVGINPDIGVAFFNLLFLYLLLRYQKKALINFKQTVILAITASASALSKFSGVANFFVYPLFIFIKNKINTKLLINLLIFFFVSFILLSPWFYLNLSRYGKLTTPSVFDIAHNQPPQPHGNLTAMFLAVYEFRHTIMHYSGFIGARNEFHPAKIFFIFYTIAVSLLSLLGLITILKNKKKLSQFFLVIIQFFSQVIFLYLLGFFFKKQGFFWDLQGRYFLSGFFILTIFLYFGMATIFKKNKQAPKIILYLFAIIHYYYILIFVLIPAYYQWPNFFWELQSLHPFFSLLFVFALTSHLSLSFSITNKLFKPSSKE